MTPHEERRERLKAFLSEDDLFRDPAAPPEAGRRLGRYRLEEMIGEGGMGVVFRAVDEELDRKVAIKMLKTAQAYSLTQMERFQREARTTARLKHPGIATLYEIGREGDTVFLSLELIEGKPFDPRSGTLPERVSILERVARAVQYAHEQGVLHRDLKPGNILVDAQGAPRLLDFGLSRDLDASDGLTRTGAFFGTAAYSSPEQAAGRVHALDARTDVYALGAVLYEAMTGAAPATGETLAEILRRVATEEPARPEGPADLVTICLKALEKDPARRYPSAGAFADDLARHLKGEPIEAKPASSFTRLQRAVVKRRGTLIPAALGLLLLAAGIALFARRPRLLDDFEQTPQGWKLILGEEFPGARGALELDASLAHGGRRSYKLAADFRGGGQYVGAWRELPLLDVEEIRVWVKSGGVRRLMVRLEDATGQCHQKHIALAPGEDWQELSLRTSEIVGGEHWGGANDGRWQGRVRGLGLNIHREGVAGPLAALWIDDVAGHARR